MFCRLVPIVITVLHVSKRGPLYIVKLGRTTLKNRTLFLPQVNSEKVDLIMHGKMTFLFTTEYVKIRFQLQILC